MKTLRRWLLIKLFCNNGIHQPLERGTLNRLPHDVEWYICPRCCGSGYVRKGAMVWIAQPHDWDVARGMYDKGISE